MPKAAKTEKVEIKVSARILRHVSRGIYRTPAAALKELVSNAYDACATDVSINTGYPTFEKIVVTDNGTGMTRADFKKLVQQIGLSEKTTGTLLDVPGATQQRHVIGHYGIGLLAVGQLASKMHVTSKEANSLTGFIAELDFDQFERRLEAGIERSKIKSEEKLERADKRSRKKDDQKFAIGTCTIRRAAFNEQDKSSHFTKIELSAIRTEVKNKLAGKLATLNPSVDEKQQYSATFQDLLRLFREREGEVRQGQYPYERLIWELSVYCPVAYPEVGLFKPGGKLEFFARLAEGYKFSLVVDGMVLKKPYEEEFFEDIARVWAWPDETYKDDSPKDCKVSAYLIFKSQIRPKVLQGALIREAGVAVGLYDSTFLEYPFNEGYKFNQLTGEIFAEGLAGSLNIDRNSFNETDDRYIALSSWFHKKLQTKVFPQIKKLQKGPGASRREENFREICRLLASTASLMDKNVAEIRFAKLGKEAPLIQATRKKIEINKDHQDGRGSSAKKEKVLLGAALVIGEYITPEVLEKVIEYLEDAKKEPQA